MTSSVNPNANGDWRQTMSATCHNPPEGGGMLPQFIDCAQAITELDSCLASCQGS